MFGMAKERKRNVAPNNRWPSRLRRLRARLSATDKPILQADCAARLGASLRAYVSWEHGDHIPHPLYQQKIKQLEQSAK